MTDFKTDGSSSSVASFQDEHRALLALLANAAKQCVNSRASECVFDAVCTAEPSLVAYPEVAVLMEVHQVRRALRNMQEGSPQVRPTFYAVVRASLDRLYEILPDPVISAIAGAMEKLRGRLPMCRVLEPHLLDVVELIQQEVLRQTNALQKRGEMITLRLRAVPPFVVS